MTEQHLNTLKTLLAKSDALENSSELDASIMATAIDNAPKAKKVPSNWLPLFPINSLATAALSITICTGVLFAMSQIILVQPKVEPDFITPLTSSSLNVEITPEQSIISDTLDEITTPIKPGVPPGFEARTRQDQILADLELPSVQSLLEGKEFPYADDRSIAEKSLNTALADINQMLRSGALNKARDRYDRLRRSCSVCDLPSSLEALALAKNNSTTRI